MIKEKEEFDSYIIERGERGKKLLGKQPFHNLQCSERNHLINRTMPVNSSKTKNNEDDGGLELIGGPKQE